MSGAEKAIGIVKSIMLMHERFDGLDKRIARTEADLTDLSRSHAELAQRVAAIEGYIRGRSDLAASQPRIAKD